jgi:Fe-S-cluster-containing hydrogenase component 2
MKCDLCNGDPACVKTCLYGALEFLTMDDWGRKKRLKGAENLVRLFDVIYK